MIENQHNVLAKVTSFFSRICFDLYTDCARDSIMYFPEKGLTVTEVCEGNGNYRPNQNAGDVYYCVDSDGYPTTEMLDAWPSGNCGNPF